jgi:hypothetical protein
MRTYQNNQLQIVKISEKPYLMSEKRVPPYPPRALFARFITDLAANGIPKRIDASIFPGLSHGALSSLLGALRYLNLIGNDGVPSETLVRLVTEEIDPQVLRPIVEDAYDFVFKGDFNLTRASAGELADHFRRQQVSGGTLKKAVAFFIALAIDADIPISVSLKQRKHPTQSNRIRRRRSRAPEAPAATAVPLPAPRPQASAEITSESLFRLLDPKRMPPNVVEAVCTLMLYLKTKEVETNEIRVTV